MIGYHTLNYLTEDVYSMNDGQDKEDIKYEISSFFNELMRRRRDDDIEEGLQAGGVIYPDKAGFKISEANGNGPHAQAQENISQYLNGETEYSNVEDLGMLMKRRNDPNAWMNIPNNGFTVRIVANKEMLIFIFDTRKYKMTDFQVDVVTNLLGHIRNAYEDGIIHYPYVNFVTGNDRFIFNERIGIDEQLDQLDSLLETKKTDTKKTR